MNVIKSYRLRFMCLFTFKNEGKFKEMLKQESTINLTSIKFHNIQHWDEIISQLTTMPTPINNIQ